MLVVVTVRRDRGRARARDRDRDRARDHDHDRDCSPGRAGARDCASCAAISAFDLRHVELLGLARPDPRARPAGARPTRGTTARRRETASASGIAEMFAAPASSCCASVSTLPNVTSVWVSEAFSNTGANARHGPHHSAQKSSRTMPGFSIVCLKLSVVMVTVAMSAAWPAASWTASHRRSFARGASLQA